MTILATASATTTARPETLFAVWADMDSWPDWNSDTAWVRLDGPCGQGATGRLKPKGGPAVPFTVTRWEPGARFTDVSRLVGARLEFDHVVEPAPDGTSVTVRISLTGLLAWAWRLILGADLVRSAPLDLAALAARAEGIDRAGDSGATA